MNARTGVVGVILVVLVLGLTGPSQAKAEEAEPPLPREVATLVLEAAARGDDAAVAELARREAPDPWLVADRLLTEDARDATLLFAGAVEGADRSALVRFVRETSPGPQDALARRALDEAADAAQAGDPARALEHLVAVEAVGSAVLPLVLQWERAANLRDLGRLREAGEIWRTVATGAQTLGWLRRAAGAWHHAGLAAHAQGDFATAKTCWESHVTVQEKRDDPQSLLVALGNLAALLNQMGERDRALELMGRTLDLGAKLGDEAAVAKTLFNRGALFQYRGEPAKALADFERALPWIEAHGGPRAEAVFHANLAVLHRQLGDAEKAVTQSTLALALDRQGGNRRGIISNLVNRSNALRDLGRADDARRDLEEAMPLAADHEDRSLLGTILSDLASLRIETGEPEGATELLAQALEIAEDTGEVSLAVSVLHNLGSVHALAGRHEEAIETYRRALRLAEGSGEEANEADLRYRLAESLHRLGRVPEALEAVRHALALHLHRLAGLSDLQSASVRAPYAGQVAFALAAAANAGDGAATFEFLEKGRALGLLEALRASGADRERRIPPRLRSGLRRARAEEAQAIAALRAARADGRRTAIRQARQQVSEARAAYAELVGRVQREARAAAAMMFPAFTTLAGMHEALAPDEAFVLYALQERTSVALVVTREQARLVGLGPRAPLEEAVAALPVEDPEVAPHAQASALRELLVDALRLPPDVRRLLISPDGALAHVPFSLLAPAYDIAYEPSATVYEHLRATAVDQGSGILALGDPEYGATGGARSRTRYGEYLTPLPATRAEAKAIGTRVLLGAEATEASLREALTSHDRWRAVHLACHGLIDAKNPLDSALAFTPEAAGDGFLTLADIYLLEVPADLVVLSACETARGTWYEGEGVLGLARGFLLAGAPRVLCSLWKVDDDATRALMIEFYARWSPKDDRTPLSAAAALRAAQEHLRAQERWKHPHYWAAWVLWGLPE